MSHTQEPWRIEDEDSIYGGDDFGLLVYEPFSDMLEKDDLIRIAACVNACAGMTNEELENHGTGGIKEWMDLADETLKAVCIAVDDVDYSGRCEQGIYALKQQREELLAALHEIAGHSGHILSGSLTSMRKIASDAIAKARRQQS